MQKRIWALIIVFVLAIGLCSCETADNVANYKITKAERGNLPKLSTVFNESGYYGGKAVFSVELDMGTEDSRKVVSGNDYSDIPDVQDYMNILKESGLYLYKKGDSICEFDYNNKLSGLVIDVLFRKNKAIGELYLTDVDKEYQDALFATLISTKNVSLKKFPTSESGKIIALGEGKNCLAGYYGKNTNSHKNIEFYFYLNKNM